MSDMKNLALTWELLGIIFIFIMGAILHFLYKWSKFWKPIALIAAVNESTWEHLKLAFWPAFFYSLFEYLTIINNFVFP